jgi:hypothetical protein
VLRALARVALPALAVALAALAFVMQIQACAASPPRSPDDACAIFRQHPQWWDATRKTHLRWGVPEALQLAIIHQESRFRPDARPIRRRVLGFIPTSRRSSAYGYGQIKDGTWSDYVKATGRSGASRREFADVADFIGWYAELIHRTTGADKRDTFAIYLAYHEGPSGYARGSHEDKNWLIGVARKVERRADLYASQLVRCPERPRDRWF